MRFGGYELIEKIGVGGMAEVYKAQRVSPEGVERTLVIKKILPEFAANHHFVRMLIAEARVSSMLHHPNIVQTFELGEVSQQHYIAMEYVPGPDLLGVLTATTRAGLRIPLGLALYIVSEVCNGLDYAHRAKDSQGRPLNLIHRDISPSNILISDDGAVKLMDFGVARADLARAGRQRAIDDTGSALKGKLGYMAPEQVTGQPVDHRADLFSLGIVLFETLTLKRLFLGQSDPETLANVRNARLDSKLARHPYIPAGVQEILKRALTKDPKARYANAAAFREALLTYLFDQRLRVTPRTLARFIHDLDWSSTAEAQPTSSMSAVDRSDDEAPTSIGVGPRPEAICSATFTLKHLIGPPPTPISYEEMTGLVHRRAIHPEEMVSIDGAPPLPYSQLIEVHDFGQLRPSTEVQAPVRQGPSNSLVLTELVHALLQSGTDWSLHVSEGPRAKMLSVRRGQIVGADSTDRQERLGHLMLSRGLLTTEALTQTIITSTERGLRLGDALVADGTVTPHTLLDILRAQLRARVLDMLSWSRGWFRLYEGLQANDTMTLDGIDGMELLTQAARANWTIETLESLFTNQMHRSLKLTPKADMPHPNLPLTPHESRIAARLIDRASVEQITEGLSEDDRLTTLRVLTLYQRTGRLLLSSDDATTQATT